MSRRASSAQKVAALGGVARLPPSQPAPSARPVARARRGALDHRGRGGGRGTASYGPTPQLGTQVGLGSPFQNLGPNRRGQGASLSLPPRALGGGGGSGPDIEKSPRKNQTS